MSAVREFASGLCADLHRIDVLFHIAGVLQTSPTRRITADGYEKTLAVNAVAPFLLARLLRDAEPTRQSEPASVRERRRSARRPSLRS